MAPRPSRTSWEWIARLHLHASFLHIYLICARIIIIRGAAVERIFTEINLDKYFYINYIFYSCVYVRKIFSRKLRYVSRKYVAMSINFYFVTLQMKSIQSGHDGEKNKADGKLCPRAEWKIYQRSEQLICLRSSVSSGLDIAIIITPFVRRLAREMARIPEGDNLGIQSAPPLSRA